MLIVGMGKLGGCELNVSSDIDLIMLYGEEGETDGPRRISHHEFYGRLTRRMMPVLSEVDANGQVFRTDLRLRPDGDAGPLAWSLDALEHYLIGQGREWERYAWLKARLMPARAFEGSDSAQARQLESLRVPFVYRKYFDFDALAALRERIRQDWQRRASARNGIDSANNIKLGDGGIREIEFVVQLAQLIRGGRMPALQRRGLLEALHAESAAGLLPEADAQRLEAAYRFLRRTEHALQYREDEQTHLLPGDPPCARRWRRRWACRPANSRTRWPRTAPSSRGLSATCSAWSAWATPSRGPPMRPTRKNPTNSARWPDRSARPSATRPTTCCGAPTR